MQRFSKKIVALVIALNIAFTGAVLYVFLDQGQTDFPSSHCLVCFSPRVTVVCRHHQGRKMKGGGPDV